MSRFEKHLFICTNERPPDIPKGCCAARDSREIAACFKDELHRRGLHKKIRANKAGCLDLCEFGPALVVYPEGVWYRQVTPADVVEIIESHLVGNRPVARLQMTPALWQEYQTLKAK